MKLKLPQVHIAVNVSGLLVGLGTVASFIVANPNAPLAFGVPTKDVAGIAVIASLIATFLPTKHPLSGTMEASAKVASDSKSTTSNSLLH